MVLNCYAVGFDALSRKGRSELSSLAGNPAPVGENCLAGDVPPTFDVGTAARVVTV